MVQIDEPPRKIKKFARRLRALAARREALTGGDIELFLAVAGLSRVWTTFEKLTEPRAAASAD
jgi:hypothetical protein